MERTRPDSGRENRDTYRDRDRAPAAGRPGVGAVVQAVITSVKPQLGLFVELPLPSKDFEGLVHLSEVIICQLTAPLGSFGFHLQVSSASVLRRFLGTFSSLSNAFEANQMNGKGLEQRLIESGRSEISLLSAF
ncbi:MAG: S1 RNA-binding domain-containing protein [Akkermansiaceae bacterium]|nr:S1 RNA-binding domain-containing protein [Akkermansiaceae bacterium]